MSKSRRWRAAITLTVLATTLFITGCAEMRQGFQDGTTSIPQDKTKYEYEPQEADSSNEEVEVVYTPVSTEENLSSVEYWEGTNIQRPSSEELTDFVASRITANLFDVISIDIWPSSPNRVPEVEVTVSVIDTRADDFYYRTHPDHASELLEYVMSLVGGFFTANNIDTSEILVYGSFREVGIIGWGYYTIGQSFEWIEDNQSTWLADSNNNGGTVSTALSSEAIERINENLRLIGLNPSMSMHLYAQISQIYYRYGYYFMGFHYAERTFNAPTPTGATAPYQFAIILIERTRDYDVPSGVRAQLIYLATSHFGHVDMFNHMLRIAE